jgi:hypothetical protein
VRQFKQRPLDWHALEANVSHAQQEGDRREEADRAEQERSSGPGEQTSVVQDVGCKSQHGGHCRGPATGRG